MQIIIGTEIAEKLRKKYTICELETFDIGGIMTIAYCVLPAESISLTEIPDLDRLCKLHQAVIDALNRKDFLTVAHGIEHLRGHFGGELDTFYDVLTERMQASTK